MAIPRRRRSSGSVHRRRPRHRAPRRGAHAGARLGLARRRPGPRPTTRPRRGTRQRCAGSAPQRRSPRTGRVAGPPPRSRLGRGSRGFVAKGRRTAREDSPGNVRAGSRSRPSTGGDARRPTIPAPANPVPAPSTDCARPHPGAAARGLTPTGAKERCDACHRRAFAPMTGALVRGDDGAALVALDLLVEAALRSPLARGGPTRDRRRGRPPTDVRFAQRLGCSAACPWPCESPRIWGHARRAQSFARLPL